MKKIIPYLKAILISFFMIIYFVLVFLRNGLFISPNDGFEDRIISQKKRFLSIYGEDPLYDKKSIKRTSAEIVEIANVLVELDIDGEIRYLSPQHLYYGNNILYKKEGEYFPGSVIVCAKRDNMNDPKKWHIVYLGAKTCELLPIRIFLLKDQNIWNSEVWRLLNFRIQ